MIKTNDQNVSFESKKLQKNNTTPPFGKFHKIHPFLRIQASQRQAAETGWWEDLSQKRGKIWNFFLKQKAGRLPFIIVTG